MFQAEVSIDWTESVHIFRSNSAGSACDPFGLCTQSVKHSETRPTQTKEKLDKSPPKRPPAGIATNHFYWFV